jgi:GDP-L-fucose synthase
MNEPINLGTGSEISIKNLASLISEIIGFNGKIIFDKTKPNGVERKILDSSKVKKLGWSHTTSLEDGIIKTYQNYLSNF